MTNSAKKFAIISKIKSLVSRTSRHILWRSKPKDNEISERIAQKIQKNSFDLSRHPASDSFTPPYLKLAEQLQVDDEQILKAAVYNLANIAVMRTKYKKDILGIFEGFMSDNTRPKDYRDYVQGKINFINASQEK